MIEWLILICIVIIGVFIKRICDFLVPMRDRLKIIDANTDVIIMVDGSKRYYIMGDDKVLVEVEEESLRKDMLTRAVRCTLACRQRYDYFHDQKCGKK